MFGLIVFDAMGDEVELPDVALVDAVMFVLGIMPSADWDIVGDALEVSYDSTVVAMVYRIQEIN